MSTSSLKTYQQARRIFQHFEIDVLNSTTSQFPIPTDALALFVAYLAENNYSAATTLTYVSALGYVHRLASLPDPTKSELIKCALKGYAKINPTLDNRLPITLPILEQLIHACEQTLSSCFQRKLIRAMFALAFFAALRVGEMTTTSGKSSTNLLLLKQVFFLKDSADSIVGIKLSMRNYKHSDTSRPTHIIIYKDKPVCAVTLLLDYLSTRGRNAGPLFCWPNNTAITRSYFAQCLSQALSFSGLDTNFYKSHSFRIGAASWAAAKGMSDAQIRTFGRWNSTAFLRYIRTPTLANSSPFNL